ncbi:MAG: hypothetical protein ACFFDI_20195 [Promethearchaeota archaeon]
MALLDMIIPFILFRVINFIIAAVIVFVIVFLIEWRLRSGLFPMSAIIPAVVGGALWAGIELFLHEMMILAWFDLINFVRAIILFFALVGSGFLLFSFIMRLFQGWNVFEKATDFWKNVGTRFTEKTTLLTAILLVIFLLSAGGNIFFFVIVPVNEAQYFDSFIVERKDDLFESEIPIDGIRLINADLARAIALRHASRFGAVNIKSLHITTYSGSLVWVATVSPVFFTNDIIEGYIIVSATDQNAEPILSLDIEPTTFNIKAGEGLFYYAELARKALTTIDGNLQYGRAYLTWDDSDNLRTVLTYNYPNLHGYSFYGGVMIFDTNGGLVARYDGLANVPNWVAQPYDENWLENKIAVWGSLRTGSHTFDPLAGGFLGLIRPSTQRVEISKDTRFILDPDLGDVVAITPVHPINNPRTCAGVFKATRNEIYFYDYSDRAYISADEVEKFVEGKLDKPASGEYYATLPILYPFHFPSESGLETKMVWYVPVYWSQSAYWDTEEQEGEPDIGRNIILDRLYIVDAENLNNHIFSLAQQKTSVQMVQEAKQGFTNLMLYGTGEQRYAANITEIHSYIENGETNFIWHTNDTEHEYLKLTPSNLDEDEWILALTANQYDVFLYTAYQAGSDSDVWIVTNLYEP